MEQRFIHDCPVMTGVHNALATAPWGVSFHRDLALERVARRLPVGPRPPVDQVEARVRDLLGLASGRWLPRLLDAAARLDPGLELGELRTLLNAITTADAEREPLIVRAVAWRAASDVAEELAVARARALACPSWDHGLGRSRDTAAAVRLVALVAEGADGFQATLERLRTVQGATMTTDAYYMTAQALRAGVPSADPQTAPGAAYPLRGPAAATVLDACIEDLAELWPRWATASPA